MKVSFLYSLARILMFVCAILTTGQVVHGAAVPKLIASSAVAFGAVPLDTTLSKDLTISNSGAADLIIGTPTVLDTDFTVDSSACGTVASGSSCVITIAFTPTIYIAKPKTATLDIPSNDPASPKKVKLIGSSRPSKISVVPTTLSFGSMKTGGVYPKRITVKNAGTSVLTISSLVVTSDNSADFSLLSGTTCGTKSLARDETCVVLIGFEPSTGGKKTGTLTFSGNSPDISSQAVSVHLTGTGDEGKVPPGTGTVFLNGPYGGSNDIREPDGSITATWDEFQVPKRLAFTYGFIPNSDMPKNARCRTHISVAGEGTIYKCDPWTDKTCVTPTNPTETSDSCWNMLNYWTMFASTNAGLATLTLNVYRVDGGRNIPLGTASQIFHLEGPQEVFIQSFAVPQDLVGGNIPHVDVVAAFNRVGNRAGYRLTVHTPGSSGNMFSWTEGMQFQRCIANNYAGLIQHYGIDAYTLGAPTLTALFFRLAPTIPGDSIPALIDRVKQSVGDGKVTMSVSTGGDDQWKIVELNNDYPIFYDSTLNINGVNVSCW